MSAIARLTRSVPAVDVKLILTFGALLGAIVVCVAACGGGGSTSDSGSGTGGAVTITTQPASQTVGAGQTATFSVVAAGVAPISYQWQKNGAAISGATSASYTTPATTSADSGTKFTAVVTNSLGSVTSAAATLTIGTTAAGGSNVDVVTYHYDTMRSGANTNETMLTPADVNSTKFGLLGSFTVDGKVDGQPLYLSNLSIPGVGTKNVLYVVTEHDSVFAFDADSVNGATSASLWKTSMLQSGEAPSDDRNCGQVTPEIGITSTPVIDRTRNAIYVVAVAKTSSGGYVHRIHALNLATGQELFGGPTVVTATYPGSGANSTNGTDTFDPKQYNERPALLEVGGTIYTTWGSHCDDGPYNSWVMAYNADTLKQTNVLNLVPDGEDGGIWMAGAGPAADASGNVYFIIGNGDFDTTLTSAGMPSNGNCGNCFVKLAPAPKMALLDYFTPSNTVSESNADVDFGSGGPLLLPDLKDSAGTTHHLAVGAGKDQNIYVVDRDSMGKFNSSKNAIYQEISGILPDAVDSSPIYFNNTMYIGGVVNPIMAFPITNAKLATAPSSKTPAHYGYPGAMPVVTASGTSNAIVWAVENGTKGILHAYDATNLATELYNSTQAANGRDTFAPNKYMTPMVTNGKVYVGTPNSVAVFGILP
ncbi:MAG TPA: immunoglobulin domain-containing protein [Candidatus Sulfotelmatobacter sp.]|nr:immunoglobulin domain-containing protein [Candidatus Sulfotelmatobacter sp.]